MITISIIIPVYNGALLISRCLDSIFKQQGNYKLEIIVIDDGSTDNTIEIVRQYAHPVIVLRQKNQGPAAARNKGIKAASGKYLAFLDADDYWAPSFLESTVRFLESNSEAIAVSVGQKHITTSSGKAGTIAPAFLESNPKKIKRPVLLENFFEFWAAHFHVCTGSILMNTQIVKNTGGQRTDLRITEDLEFWAYLATFGRIGFIPKILFVSDGGIVTKKTGWLKKNKKRWASAPSVEKWEERIVKAIPDKDVKQYQIARGRIAKNLCYSMIMSGRTKQARMLCLKYKSSFPNDKVSRLLSTGSNFVLCWIFAVLVIYIREYTRIIVIR